MFWCLALTAAVAAPPTLLNVTIRDSLEATLVRSMPEGGNILSAQVARLLRWRGDVTRHIHRGDELTVLYEPGVDPLLVAMGFRGTQLQLRAYRFLDADGIPRYYDETGALIEPVLLNSPVPGYWQITETVQWGRGKRRHKGIDLKAPEGEPILLPFSGTVLRRNWHTGINGNCIEIAYDNGKVARFLHLAQVASQVRPGVRLRAGTRLGTVGSTGRSNAAHLHYEILDGAGRALEPLFVHGHREARMAVEHLASFATQRDAHDRHLRGPSGVMLEASLSDTCGIGDAQVEESLSCQP